MQVLWQTFYNTTLERKECKILLYKMPAFFFEGKAQFVLPRLREDVSQKTIGIKKI